MFYDVKISVKIESSLKKEELENKLVISLYDFENGYSKFDRVDDELEVIDYEYSDVEEIEENKMLK